MKVALVTDWMYGGGSEKVVEQMHFLYPDAPIYTSYCSDDWRKRLNGKVITGYLQHAPFRQLRKFLPLLRQWWFARLDLTGFDLVISVSGNGEAKFVRAPNGTHVSYCNTPVHFYWRHYDTYLQNPGFRPKWLVRLGMKLLVKPLRKRDYQAAQKVDYFIANSSQISRDIKQFYNRDSVAIFPPIDTRRFTKIKQPASRHGFVSLGRLVPMKRFDLVIEACNELSVPLTVIGRGPEYARLTELTGPTVRIRNDVSDEELPRLLAGAEGFLFASFEDFGIAPVEALAAGTPVIAYKAGGALDYVTPGATGEFFAEQTAASLVSTLQNFDTRRYKPSDLQKRAEKFSEEMFQKRLKDFIKSL